MYNLKIVNALDNTNTNNNLYNINYIPFSISTIKLLIQNKEDSKIKVIINPIRSQNDEDYCGGFDDDKKGLKITWGGGQKMAYTFQSKKRRKNMHTFLFFIWGTLTCCQIII